MCGAGRRTLIFPITFKRTFAGRCRIREQNRDFGIIPEREFILPQGTNFQNFRELSGKQICRDTERRARNPVEGSERAQSHHDTEWDEARGKSKSRSCAVIERDDGRINHNSYSIPLAAGLGIRDILKSCVSDGTWSGSRCRYFPAHHIRPEFLKCGLANIKHTF